MIFISLAGWVLLAANGAAAAEAATNVSSIFPGGWLFLWTLVPATFAVWLSRWQMYLAQVKEYKERVAGLVRAILLHPLEIETALDLSLPPLPWRTALRILLWRFKPTVYGVVAFYDAEREVYFVTFVWLRADTVMDGYRQILLAFDLAQTPLDALAQEPACPAQVRLGYGNCVVQMGRLPRPRRLRTAMAPR